MEIKVDDDYNNKEDEAGEGPNQQETRRTMKNIISIGKKDNTAPTNNSGQQLTPSQRSC